jgi:chloramphenicol 3-O-phosphotransferase
VLPGQIPDRETVEGWKQWRCSRHRFAPAPRLDLAAYRVLSPRRRQLHDLHRAATHANLPLQETPMSRAVGRLMRSRLQTNALKHKPTTRPGLMITGGGYQGKTETACEIAAAFEDVWLDMHAQLNPTALPGTRDLHAPVAYVQTPVTAKPKSTCQAILDFFGAEHQRMTLPQLTKAVRGSLHDHGNRVLLLDDITRLKMHRADDQDTLDLVRALMSMHTTLVLIGVDIPGSGLLREGHHDPRTRQWVFPPPAGRHLGDDPCTQTERRFDLVHLEPFRYDTPNNITAWTTHLGRLQDALRLFQARPDMLTGATMPEYLFRRTGGVVGLLERLIEEGCAEAIDSGAENLTEDLLDNILINLGNDPTRDPTAGEVPSVPAPPRAGGTRRPRNTVFDDRGVPVEPTSASSA